MKITIELSRQEFDEIIKVMGYALSAMRLEREKANLMGIAFGGDRKIFYLHDLLNKLTEEYINSRDKLLQEGMQLETVSQLTELPIAEVQAISDDLKRSNH